MTHRYGISNGVPLANFSAHASNEGFQLLVRVVDVNGNGKLTLPVRELWAGSHDALGEIDYLVYSANNVEDDEENRVTLEEANECLSMWGEPWLRSLEPSSPFGAAGTERWYVTSLVRADRCIWNRQGVCYIVGEENLRVWLDEGFGQVERFDSEEDWWCLTHNSSDEDSLESARKRQDTDEDEDMDDGGVNLTGSEETKVIVERPKMDFSLVECEANNMDVGYDGDVE